MKSITHAVFATTATSLFLGTAEPTLLLTGALASQLPDVDTSKSIPGRILLPISSWLEKRYPHRTITHSFLATGAIALVTLPIALITTKLWQALVLGYFCGWFADVFTKSGVAAFYPSVARLVIPGNPQLRLSTGSPAEYFVIALLILVAIALLTINSNGGILRTFNSTLGIPSGAVEIVNSEGSQYLLMAQVYGRWAIAQQSVNEKFEVVRPLTQTDLLLKDASGKLYRVGSSQNCQIIASRILIERNSPIQLQVQELQLSDQVVAEVLAQYQSLTSERTYINGTLTVEDAEDLVVPTHADSFDTITLQYGREMGVVRLESASPAEVLSLLGDYYASGSLIIRTVEVL